MAGRYTTDVSFPFQFTEDCDLYQDEDAQVINQAINLLSMTPQGTVLLWSAFGSQADVSVFDPLDNATELVIDTSIRKAIEALEPRVYLDKDFIFDESSDGHTLFIIIPFRIVVSNEVAASRLTFRKAVSG